MSGVNTSKVFLELVTPTFLAISEDVDMVVVPGVDGDFGVLRGHTPILTTVRPGVIKMYVGGAVVKTFFIEGGIAEANPEKCTVLAEFIHNIDDIISYRFKLMKVVQHIGFYLIKTYLLNLI